MSKSNRLVQLFENLYLPFHYCALLHLLKPPVQCRIIMVIGITAFIYRTKMCFVCKHNICFSRWIFSIIFNWFPPIPYYLEFLLGMCIELFKYILSTFVLDIWFFYINLLKLCYITLCWCIFNIETPSLVWNHLIWL